MNGKLLLIDDDVRLTAMVGDYLRANGYDVDAAGSLGAGRERLRGTQYDALVLDLMLPDGDGLDLTRELRADTRTKRLPTKVTHHFVMLFCAARHFGGVSALRRKWSDILMVKTSAALLTSSAKALDN